MFITLEGIEGSGKSTLQQGLASFLRDSGRRVILTREPGGTRLGEKIRELLLRDSSLSIDPLSELLLFSADRAQHLAEVVRPALAGGAFVLCDRYLDSTLAYQGFGRGVEPSLLQRCIELGSGGLKPQLTFLLDLDPRIGLRRASSRAAVSPQSDRFESLDLQFHERVREGFLQLAQQDSARFVVIDGSLPAPEVLRLSIDSLKCRL